MRMAAMLALGSLLVPVRAARADACKSDATQLDLDQCAEHDFERAEAALNATYERSWIACTATQTPGSCSSRLRKPGSASATRTARSWPPAHAAGPIHPMIVSGCRAQLTRDRTKVLQGDLTCQEGDTSCPVPPR